LRPATETKRRRGRTARDAGVESTIEGEIIEVETTRFRT
jgi:hypothetical protein